MPQEQNKPNTYEIKPTADENVYTVEGLRDPILGRNVVVITQPDDNFRDVVNEVRNVNRQVSEKDIFVTPGGKFQVSGGMVVPYEDPAPDEQEKATDEQQTAAQATPTTVSVPLVARDSHGKVYSATLDLPWPGATSSQIVAAFDTAANATTPGNVINTIKVPASNVRIIEIGYNNDQTRVVIEVG